MSEKETPEIFTNEEREAAGETDEELSVFSSEEVPEFNDALDETMAAAENAQNGVIDLTADVTGGVYTISLAGDYHFTCQNSSYTTNRIEVDGKNIPAQANISIYLHNVNIDTSAGPALLITGQTTANVCIYLKGTNNLITTKASSAGLQKDNLAKLTINNAPDSSGSLNASNDNGQGAGIGGGSNEPGTNIYILGGSVTANSYWGAGIGGGLNDSGTYIYILGGSVTATSKRGAGIGGGCNDSGTTSIDGNGSNIHISNSSVTANSPFGAGIGGGDNVSGINGTCNGGNGSDIHISNSSVTANSTKGAGIGGGRNVPGTNGTCNGGNGSDIHISNSSVTANSTKGAGIGGGLRNNGSPSAIGSCSNITISGGSVNAHSDRNDCITGINCIPQNGNSSNVYCCIIKNEYYLPVTIDNSTSRNPSNHIFPDSKKDDNLYVWLIEKENNAPYNVTVGTEKRQYSFDQNSKQFVRIETPTTADQFDFTSPNFTYTNTPVDITSNINWKSDITGHGAITAIKYYSDATLLNEAPKDAGTYTFKINVDKRQYYKSAVDISSSEWAFVISKAHAPSNIPNSITIPVPWTCKKVADITTNLPTNWNWQDSSKYLQVGSNSVIAVYNGSDAGKDNYERETVTYTITRSKCAHEHTAGRYYSSPSCTSSGYSGDTYCTDCNETLSYGYTISAYGHDYDIGVITTEPTTETDGIITYTCKRCKYQDTKTLGKLGDGEPYIEGSFQKKGWDAVNDLIKASKEKDTFSITLNGSRTLPASVLSGIKGKDISLNLDMENGFIWKINGTSITAETPADTDLSVTNTAEHIPAALYSLISANQNDFGFHLGRSGAFDFPAVLSVKADASCAGLMANLFWYDVENGVLQCIQTVTVGGAFERSIPYADFTLSKGQDYFIAFGTESLNGRVIHTDGSITDENGAYLRPANAKISSHSIDRNKLTVKLSKGCAGAQGYDFVISKKSNMLQTGKFSKTVSSTGKPQASFRYLAKGTWYVAARSWVLDEQGNKVYGSWTKIKKIKITVVTPQQPKIKDITVKENTVTVTYTKCKNATGYEILLGNKYKTSAGEKYPVKKYVKRTEGKNTVIVTFTNVKKGTWYVTVRSWNKTSKNKSRVYSPYSDIKKFKVKK